MKVKKLIFIVEDNVAQQKMLQMHFEQILGDFVVRVFTHPEELLPHLKEKPFAIVMDHFFTDTANTGLYYLRKIRAQFRKLPVIYYTAAHDEKVKQEALELGVEEYIVKDSASLVRLRTSLDTILAKSSKKGFFGRLFG